jgi:hypothetical protein
MKNFRVGDKVCFITHMSNKGEVLKVEFRPVTANNMSGVFSKMMWIHFKSELDGNTYIAKAQDLMRAD